MSDEKFTKGEWEISNSYPCLDIVHEHPAVWADGYCVAQMCDLDESTANAHLIAAAPDMYHALKRLHMAMLKVDESSDETVSLGKLLAKAGGES